jgi:hypothetical protein
VAAFIEEFFFCPLILLFARVPLKSGWRTTGGMRTTVLGDDKPSFLKYNTPSSELFVTDCIATAVALMH